MADQTPTLATQLAPYLAALDDEMRAVVAVDEPALAPFYGMLHYHLGWVDDTFQPTAGRSGKRLRPLFLLLACEAAGGEWRRAVPAAAAIELTHNFSLIHDDVEDRDETRHGRPTLWKRWGDAQAINAGDGLFVLARLAFARLLDWGVSAGTLTRVSVVYDRACLAITEGQYLDMSFEDRLAVTEADYLRMISGKTAALLSASTHIGALLAEAPADVVATLAHFGHALGLAFQIRDDDLGVWGDPAQTGKRAANDIRRRKKSLPVAYAFEHADAADGETLRRLYSQSVLSEADVQRVVAILEASGAADHVRRLTDDYLSQARQALAPFTTTPAGGVLLTLTDSLARRAF